MLVDIVKEVCLASNGLFVAKMSSKRWHVRIYMLSIRSQLLNDILVHRLCSLKDASGTRISHHQSLCGKKRSNTIRTPHYIPRKVVWVKKIVCTKEVLLLDGCLVAFVTALKDSKSLERCTVPKIYHHLTRTSDPSIWEITLGNEIFTAFHIAGKAL